MKTKTATILRSSVSAITIIALLGSNAAFALDTSALPTGGTVAHGSATMNYGANQLDIHQQSQQAVIDWNSFNIGTNAKTEFYQPNSAAVAVNRVHDVNPSQILGTLRANGNVVVLNTSGVVFGQNATVDVGGLVASTGTLDMDAFQNSGKLNLSNISAGGSIVNDGAITVAAGGLAAFVAPHVVNNGSIRANLGKVVLAGGADRATVDLYGDKLVELALDDKASKAVIENTGLIQANGGTVEVTVAAAQGIVDSVVNLGGVVEANAIDTTDGKIVLKAQNADVILTGDINAKGDTGNAGKVEVRTNRSIAMAPDAKINADAGANGNGGTVDVVADQNFFFYGVISARGGSVSGNGGAVDTSGLEYIDVSGSVNAGAVNGNGGTWLIDPRDLEIVAGSTNTNVGGSSPNWSSINSSGLTLGGILGGTPSRLAVNNITTALNNGTNVVVTTVGSPFVLGHSGDIRITTDINTAITGTNVITGLKEATLTLNAAGGISFTGGTGITNTRGALNIDMRAGNAININRAITTNGGFVSLASKGAITLDSAIATKGGAVTITTTNGILPGINFNSTVETRGGELLVNAAGATTVANGASINTGGGNATVTSALGNTINGEVLTKGGNLTISGLNTTLGATGIINTGGPSANGFVDINSSLATALNGQIITKGGLLTVDSSLASNIGSTADINTGGADFIITSGTNTDIAGIVATKGGALTVNSNLQSGIASTGSVDTDGGDVTLNGGLTSIVDGTVKTKSGNFTADSTLNTGIGATGSVDTNGGDVTLTGGLAVTVNGGIETNGGAMLLDAATVTGIGSTAVITTGGGSANLYSGVLTTIEGSIETMGGSFYANGGAIFAIANTGSVYTNAGTLDVVAGTVVVNGDLLTNGSTITLMAADNLNISADGEIKSRGGDIEIYADAMDVQGKIDAADGVLTIGRNDSVGRIILGTDGLGGMMPKLHLTQAEIDNMTAKKLVVGRSGGTVDNDIVVHDANLRSFNRTVLQTMADAGSTQEVQFIGDNKFAKLNVRADDSVIFWSDSENAATGDVNIKADTDKDGQGDVYFENYSLLKTNGDDITIKTNALILSDGIINANGGNIDIINFDRFYSSAKNSLRTEGNGSIWLTQFANGSIQNAVDAFHNTGNGDNILYLEPGSWTEQVRLTQKNFTLQGSGKGSTVITAPAGMSKFNANGERIAAIISARDVENVHVTGITVDGNNAGDLSGNNVDRFAGIAFFNASGTSSKNEIVNMTSTSGTRQGTGLFVASDDSVMRGFTSFKDRISNFEGAGVYAENIGSINVSGARIDGNSIGEAGIQVKDVFLAESYQNRIRNVGTGLSIDGGLSGLSVSNRITNTDTAIAMSNLFVSNNAANVIRNTGTAISLNNTGMFSLVDSNRVYNADTGLVVGGPSTGGVILVNNRFKTNVLGAQLNAGEILFVGKNRFIGGVTGIALDGTLVSIAGDTLGKTRFRGQNGDYVTLSNSALAGKFIDASDVKFDGVKADFADQAALNAIEAKLTDFDDNNGLGQILSILPTPAAPNSPQPSDITRILPWQFFAQFAKTYGGSITITGLPYAPGMIPASVLANLDSAAGGPLSPEQLNNLDSAAGGTEANCWGDVYSNMGSGAVTFNVNSSPTALINSQSGCGI